MSKRNRLFYFVGFGLAMLLALGGHVLAAFITFTLLEAAITLPNARCCDNVLGTLATATIVQEALALVFTMRPVLNNISMGFTDQNGSPIAAFNQPVITRTLGVPAVGNAGDAAAARADVDVSVTLNNYKQVRYDFTPQQYSGTNRDLVRESAIPMAVAIANYIVDQVAALWTIGNFPVRTGADAVANGSTVSKTVKGAGWDYTHLTEVRGVLNKSGVPEFNRFYVGNSDVYGSMLTDLRIVGWLNNQDNQSAIKMGKLPTVAGFGLAEYPNLTAVAGAHLVGFAGSSDSTVYAHRVPKDPREVIKGLPVPGNVGIITEPKTGLSVMVVEYVDLNTMNVTTKLMWMNGVAVGNPNNGQLITSQ